MIYITQRKCNETVKIFLSSNSPNARFKFVKVHKVCAFIKFKLIYGGIFYEEI